MADEPSGLRRWAQGMTSAPERTKLLAMDPGTSTGTVRVPFQTVSRALYLGKIKGSGIFKRAEDAPIKSVPLKELTAIQQTVNAEKLQGYVEGPHKVSKGARAPGHGGLIDLPVVVKTGDRLFLHDGHHRATAAHVRGDRNIRARVVDLDASGWKRDE